MPHPRAVGILQMDAGEDVKAVFFYFMVIRRRPAVVADSLPSP